MYNSKYDENIKKKIKEQDKAKLEFKRKLSNIMQDYGIDFDVDLLENNNIDKIKFYNLKYKNIARDVSIVFDNENSYYGAYIYTINKNKTMTNEDYNTKKNYFNKNYKLDLVITEIRQTNNLYKEELKKIDTKYEELNKQDIELEKNYKNKTYPKNE